MIKAQFRWLLIGYVVIVIMSFIPELYSHLIIPDVVLKLEPSYVAVAESMPLPLRMVRPIMAGAGLMGIIGMFCLWSPGRYIFLLGVAMRTLGFPLFFSWTVTTGWGVLFSEITVILDGTILTLSLFGPAKHLFNGKKSR